MRSRPMAVGCHEVWIRTGYSDSRFYGTLPCCVALFVFLILVQSTQLCESLEPVLNPERYRRSNLLPGEKRQCANDTAILNIILDAKTYKKNTLPMEHMVVEVELWIQEVSKIDEYNSEFTTDIYVTEQWLDPALSFDFLDPCKQNLSVDGTNVIEKIWTPRACFVNAKKASVHKSPYRNVFLMFYSNGTVWLNYRVKITGPCVKNLKSFPIDYQQCFLVYESFIHNVDEVEMRWSRIRTPLLLLKEIKLPDYHLINFSFLEIQRNYHPGVWQELLSTYTFKRLYGFYILQAYVPTYLSVLLSWISFFLGAKHLAPRTTLGVSSLLALTFQFATVSSGLPRSSEVKAIDVWILACLGFIFASLMELAIVGSVVRNDVNNAVTCRCSWLCMKCPYWSANKIDGFSMMFFPASFLMFNVYYFFVYLG